MDHPGIQHSLLASLPNLLSGFRLGLAAALPLVDAKWWGVMILIGGLSDFADGVIARRFKITSWIGGHLDAVADKALVITLLVMLVVIGRLEAWQVGLLVVRDLVVLGIAAYGAVIRAWWAFRKMPSRLPGKVATTAAFVFLVTVTMQPDWAGAIALLFWLAASCSAWAGLDYCLVFIRSPRTPPQAGAVATSSPKPATGSDL